MTRPHRAVTILDLAKAANVSKATVSVVLSDRATAVRISEATRAAVLAAAAQLGYTPNYAARNLRRRHTGAIILVVTNLGNPYYAEIAMAAVDAAKALGYEVDLVSGGSPAGEHEALRRLRGGRADGVVVAMARGTLRDPEASRAALIAREQARRDLVDVGLPMVVLLDRGPNFSVPSVRIDDEEGACLATRHLLSLGHRRIAHVTIRPPVRDDESTAAADRYRGYRRALAEAGVAFDSRWLISDGGHDLEGGRTAARAWLDLGTDRPTAALAFNDLLAISLLRGLHEVGARVPDDLALVGFDGIELGEFTIPSLTTIDNPRRELGRLGVEQLVALLTGHRPAEPERVLPIRLVVRESCGAHWHSNDPKVADSHTSADRVLAATVASAEATSGQTVSATNGSASPAAMSGQPRRRRSAAVRGSSRRSQTRQ